MVGLSSIPSKEYIYDRLKHCTSCDRFGHLASTCTGFFCQACGDTSGSCSCSSSISGQDSHRAAHTLSCHEPCIMGRSTPILMCLACSSAGHRTTNCPGLRRCSLCHHLGHRAHKPNLCCRLPKVHWTHIRQHATTYSEILPRKILLSSMEDNPADIGMARTNQDTRVHKVWVRKQNIS